jgi:hypothetical protein
MHTRWLMRQSLGRQFEWLWAAYAVSATGDLLDGWRYILASRALRPVFFNALTPVTR